MTDITAGILGAMGILATAFERQKTGKGQRVDTSLFEAGIVHTYWQSAIALATGTPPGPMGSAHPLNAPYQAFQTIDGWITVGAANQVNWLRLLEVLEAPHLAEDTRFAGSADRMGHQEELAAALGEIIRRRTSADWLERLEAAGVPAGPVLDVAQMHADPQTLARDMVVTLEHARAGAVKALGLPVKFSESPGEVAHAAPLYGADTRAILAEHGYGEDEIATLLSEGAVVAA